MVGVGRGAEAGVLIKNAEALERLETVDTIVVDKTGTLTEGRPRLTGLSAMPGFTESELLRLAASLERASEHPLARAIVAAASDQGRRLGEPVGFAAPTGRGVRGRVEGRAVLLGSARFLAESGIDAGRLGTAAEAMRSDGATAVLMAVDGKPAGLLGIA